MGSTMVKKRRRHLPACKFWIGLGALEGSKTIGQLYSEHETHPKLIQAWKRQLPDDGPSFKSEDNFFTR